MAGITHSTPADGTFSGTGATAWDDNHVITELGGQALTVSTIANGEFLKRNGTTITSGSPSGNTDILAADAASTDFDLTNGGAGGAVQILSKSITGITAKDQVIIEADFTILNNSGGTPTYALGGSLGSFTFAAIDGSSVTASATNRSPKYVRVAWAITSSSIANIRLSQLGVQALADGAANNLFTQFSRSLWGSSSADCTGTQTATLTVSSTTATSTQTLTLNNYTIRKISSNP